MTRRDLGVAGVAIIGTLALMPRARSQGTEQAVMGSTAVRLLSQRSVVLERPPFQPLSLLCFSRSIVIVTQFDSAGM